MTKQFTQQIRKNEEHFSEQLRRIRTGRAHPDMVGDILVDSYGAKTPLSQLGSISVTDSRSLAVEPWDKNIIKDIEKAVVAANRNVSCSADGVCVRIRMPEMTQENRQQAVKSLHDMLERSRVSARQAREEEKKSIEKLASVGELTEDDRRDEIKNLDEATKAAVSELEKVAEKKEQELLQL